jgi:fatty-acyl-CoA synthase
MPYLFTTYVAVLLIVVFPPLWMVLLLLPPGRWPGVALKQCARLLIAASGCRFNVVGADHLRASLPAVFAVNHTSYLDSVVLMAALPTGCRFVANHRLAGIPFIGTAIRKARYLTVNRTLLKARARCMSDMIETIRAGTSVVVYPEATTSRSGGLLPFRPGAFRVAVETQRPVVPVTINGTAAIWPRGSWMMRPGPIEVCIHERLEVTTRGREEIERLRDRTRAAIQSNARGSSG